MSSSRPFNTRGFTSFIIMISSLVVALSGLMLYVSPKGRVANWTGWSMLGLDKHQWEALHLTMAIALFLGVLFHLYFNWNFLMRYLRDLAEKGVSSKRELGSASVIVLLVFLGTHYEVPPFSTVSTVGEDIKNFWEETGPVVPYAHAEDSTIGEFAANMDLPLDEVTRRLQERGFQVDSTDLVIADVAEAHDMTPDQLFQAMTRRGNGNGNGNGGNGGGNGNGGGRGAGRGGAGGVGGSGGGGGMGQRTLQTICDTEGIALDNAIAILREHGIEAKGEDTMRTVAHDHGVTPYDVIAWFQAAKQQAG